MKNIKSYINEALVTTKPTGKFNKFKYHPMTKDELIEVIETELKAGNENLNCIDTSAITDMSRLFNYLYCIDVRNYPNIDVSEWDVSNVTDMSSMFGHCKNFTCDLSKWDVSKVKNMIFMFAYCENFNSDLSNWDVSQVRNMVYMFDECKNFNCDLSKWDVSNIIDMSYIFKGCPKLESIYGETPQIKNGKLVKL